MKISNDFNWLRTGLIGLGIVGAFIIGVTVGLDKRHLLMYAVGVIGLLVCLLQPHFALYVFLGLVPLQNIIVISEGVTALKIFGGVVFAGWVMRKIIKGETFQTAISYPLFVPTLIYLFFAGISVLWTSNIGRWSQFMLTSIQLIGMVSLMVDLLDYKARLQRAIFCFLVGSLFSFGIGIYNSFVLNEYRASGGYGTGNAFASLALSVLPFMVFLITYRRGWQRLMGMLGAFTAVLGTGVSVSRTNLIILLFNFLLQLFIWRKSGVALSRILIVLLVVTIAVSIFPWDTVTTRFEQLMDGDELMSTFGRGWRMNFALRRFAKNPIWGYGLGSSEGPSQYYPSGYYFVIHNTFLQIAIELGLTGLLIILWIWGTAIHSLGKTLSILRQRHNDSHKETMAFLWALALGLTNYTIYSFTANIEYSRILWILFAFTQVTFLLVRELDLSVGVKSGRYLR